MTDVLVYMMMLEWAAKKLHYECRGSYGLHLLGDRVSDEMDGLPDQLKETYWLGFNMSNPPEEREIAATSADRWNECRERAAVGNAPESDDDKNRVLLSLLEHVSSLLAVSVEAAKKEQGIPAGVHAVLDAISQKALTVKFLSESAKT